MSDSPSHECHSPAAKPALTPANDRRASSPAGDRIATALRGCGPVGILATLIILFIGSLRSHGLPVVPIGALLALAWAWRSRTPWADVGYVRPQSWPRTVALGILMGSVLKLVMKAIVMPLMGAPPVNVAYQFLAGNDELLPIAVWAMLVAGFSEETVYRGFLFARLKPIFGSGRPSLAAIVVLTSLWFGAEHYGNQGIPGVLQATVVGLTLGTVYVRTGNIWLVICAHAAFDLTALAMIYWRVESFISRLLFE